MSERQRILIIDDDADLRSSLAAFLERSGFAVLTASDGQLALSGTDIQRADLIVLDVLMPGLDGREVLRRLREKGLWTPVILLTRVGDAVERAMALEEGADDYLNKPFEGHELVARIRAILRRGVQGSESPSRARVLHCGRLRLDRRTQQAELSGRALELTPRALQLLTYLMMHPDELISRERLMDAVWGWEQVVASRAVDARIAELRRALEEDPENPSYIETVPGLGYRFIGKVETS